MDTDVAQALILLVGQGESRGDRDGVSRVNADRVNIFNLTDDHGVVGAVTHELEFVLFPAQN